MQKFIISIPYNLYCLFSHKIRCLDHHGGYLYHEPERCGQIITACAVLHNIALNYEVPILPDADIDRFRNHHADPGQPRNIVAPQGQDINYVDRTNFIHNRF